MYIILALMIVIVMTYNMTMYYLKKIDKKKVSREEELEKFKKLVENAADIKSKSIFRE